MPPQPSEHSLALVDDRNRLAALDGYNVLDTTPEQAFEDVVRLASRLCGVPVALVSLVSHDRQWFKARIGFPPCETDLDRSVCKYALAEPDLLVIPDLTDDPRTAMNPLVTGEPFIRFYAGAPLRSPDGHALGSLCVIDTVARPTGLSAEQADDLRTLARHVADLLELRASRTYLAASEAHWRGLFERLSEGFIVGEVIRDAEGAIRDWRYIDVNAAWGDLVSIDPATAVGRTIREVFPGIEDTWVNEFADVVETGQPVTFTRQVGTLARWYEGRAFSLGGERFGVIFLEITERVQAESRRAAVLALNDRLRDLTTIEAMTLATCETLGVTLDAMLVGYGDVDPRRETITVERDWITGGAKTLAGTLNFRDFGSYIEDLKRGETVIVTDCRTDPRTRDYAAALEARSARAFVNTPVFERGAFVALLYVSTAEARHWKRPELAFIRDVASRLRLSIGRVHAEEQQDLLNHELSHRLKNTLAMVMSIVHQTLRSIPDREPVETLHQRIQALASAHDMLLRRSWTAADLRTVCGEVLRAAVPIERVTLDGPDVALGPSAALSISLLTHEMATNAAKHGSLSTEVGQVALRWRIEDGADGPDLVLHWREYDGPPVVTPTRRGFGSRLIRTGIVGTGQVEVTFASEGVEAVMRAPLVEVQRS